jgi:hypothetical protein
MSFSYGHLIYASVATQDYSEGELDKILESAVRNNARLEVTGLLLYSNRRFLQVLEGNPNVLNELINRIKVDPRHEKVNILVRAPIKEREFPQWHMGFRRLTDSDVIAHPNYAPFFEKGFNAEQLTAQPGLALRMMKALAF